MFRVTKSDASFCSFHSQNAYNYIIPHLSLLGLHDLLVLLLGDPLGLGRQQLIQQVWDVRFVWSTMYNVSPEVMLCVSISISSASIMIAVSSMVTLATLLAMLRSLLY